MDINILYFLMRLYSLCEDFENGNKDFSTLYREIISCTDCDIVSNIPENIRADSEKLCENFSEQGLSELLDALKPYKEKCEALLPDLSALNEEFVSLLCDEFCENGYFLGDGVFRKIRLSHLYILECELSSAFIADEAGRVSKIRIAPIVRIADTPIKKTRDGRVVLKQSGILDDDATVTDAKLYEPNAFYKNLRHLEYVEFAIDEKKEVSDKDLARLANSARVASAVCENRAIPSYYKKLCKNDFPKDKAIKAAVCTSVIFFLLATIFIAFALGLLVWMAVGLKRIWGLFTVPYYYLFTALLSAVYGIITYKKIRSGRY